MLFLFVAFSSAQVKTVHVFNGTDGSGGEPLILGRDGNFYGTGIVGNIFRMTPSGTVTNLYTFCQGRGCGFFLNGLVLAADGSFYGTTNAGGKGGGTLFRFTLDGTLTTLYEFCTLQLCADGSNPLGTLVQGNDGHFYGTTSQKGAHGGGTVFKITPDGALTTLYSFCAVTGCPDGSFPSAGLVLARDGNFYGTTTFGGASNQGGTIFKITPSGTLTTLHVFCTETGCPDGSNPQYAALVQATDGNFYGTASTGGSADRGCPPSCGTVFKMTPGGEVTTLHAFNGHDGNSPQSGLVQASDGNLYGATEGGGATNLGTLFRITLSGTLTSLYNFCDQGFIHCKDGSYPNTVLVEGPNQKLYGTTLGEFSAEPWGTAYQLSVGH